MPYIGLQAAVGRFACCNNPERYCRKSKNPGRIIHVRQAEPSVEGHRSRTKRHSSLQIEGRMVGAGGGGGLFSHVEDQNDYGSSKTLATEREEE